MPSIFKTEKCFIRDVLIHFQITCCENIKTLEMYICLISVLKLIYSFNNLNNIKLNLKTQRRVGYYFSTKQIHRMYITFSYLLTQQISKAFYILEYLLSIWKKIRMFWTVKSTIQYKHEYRISMDQYSGLVGFFLQLSALSFWRVTKIRICILSHTMKPVEN